MPRYVTVKGLAEFEEKMKRFPVQMRREILKSVVLSGAEILRQYVATQAQPLRDTGDLQDSIVAKLSKGTEAGREAVAYTAIDMRKIRKTRISINGRLQKVRYPYMLERGTKAHEIKRPRGGVLRIAPGVFRAVVKHPGVRPRGFFSTGIRRGRYTARTTMEAQLKTKTEALNG